MFSKVWAWSYLYFSRILDTSLKIYAAHHPHPLSNCKIKVTGLGFEILL